MRARIEPRHLLRSLGSLLVKLEEEFDRQQAEDFCRFYDELKASLNIYAEENNSRFIAEKVSQFPPIHVDQLTTERNWIQQLLGTDGGFFGGAMRSSRIKETKRQLESLINPLIAVLENPGLDELYYMAEDNNTNLP